MQDIDGNGIRRDLFQRKSELDQLFIRLAHAQNPAAAYLEAQSFCRADRREFLRDRVRGAKLREKRRRGFDITVQSLKPGFFEPPEVIFRQEPQRGAQVNIRRFAHLLQRFADIVHILSRKPLSRSNDADAVRSVGFRFLCRFHARFRSDPAINCAARFPAARLCAPLAVLRTASAPGIDDGAKIEPFFDTLFRYLMRPLPKFLPPLRFQQSQRFFSGDSLKFPVFHFF